MKAASSKLRTCFLASAVIGLSYLPFIADTSYGQSIIEGQAITTNRLTIEVSKDFSSQLDTSGVDVFKQNCNAFAKALSKNAGLWATGPFKALRCSTTAPTKSRPSAFWQLSISPGETGIEFQILYHPRTGIPVEAAKYILVGADDLTEVLNDKVLRDFIAARLSLSLPMRSAVSDISLTQETTLRGRTKKMEGVKLPKNLFVFELSVANGTWRPNVRAKMALKSESATKVSWQVSSVTDAPPSKVYFIQQAEDRDLWMATLDREIEARAEKVLRNTRSKGRTAYMGFRYGYPFLGGQGPLSKAPLYGILAEFRSGSLKGLRLNYDLIPKNTVTSEISNESYQSSRLQLGYSFGTTLDIPLINWVDVTPRLGITNIQYDYEPISDADEAPAQFLQKGAPTTGLEIGLENRQSKFLVRAWGFGNYSVGVVKIDKKFSTRSFRIGVDIFRDILDLGSTRMSLLGFSAYDSTHIERVMEPGDENENIVEELDFLVVYLGAGLTLSWQ